MSQFLGFFFLLYYVVYFVKYCCFQIVVHQPLPIVIIVFLFIIFLTTVSCLSWAAVIFSTGIYIYKSAESSSRNLIAFPLWDIWLSKIEPDRERSALPPPNSAYLIWQFEHYHHDKPTLAFLFLCYTKFFI